MEEEERGKEREGGRVWGRREWMEREIPTHPASTLPTYTHAFSFMSPTFFTATFFPLFFKPDLSSLTLSLSSLFLVIHPFSGRDRGTTRYIVKSRSPRTPRDRMDERIRETTPRGQGGTGGRNIKVERIPARKVQKAPQLSGIYRFKGGSGKEEPSQARRKGGEERKGAGDSHGENRREEQKGSGQASQRDKQTADQKGEDNAEGGEMETSSGDNNDDIDEENNEDQSGTESPNGTSSCWQPWQIQLKTKTLREERDRFICDKAMAMGHAKGHVEGYKQAWKDRDNKAENQNIAHVNQIIQLHEILMETKKKAMEFARFIGREVITADLTGDVDIQETIQANGFNHYRKTFPRPMNWDSKEGLEERRNFQIEVNEFKDWKEAKDKKVEDERQRQNQSGNEQKDGGIAGDGDAIAGETTAEEEEQKENDFTEVQLDTNMHSPTIRSLSTISEVHATGITLPDCFMHRDRGRLWLGNDPPGPDFRAIVDWYSGEVYAPVPRTTRENLKDFIRRYCTEDTWTEIKRWQNAAGGKIMCTEGPYGEDDVTAWEQDNAGLASNVANQENYRLLRHKEYEEDMKFEQKYEKLALEFIKKRRQESQQHLEGVGNIGGSEEWRYQVRDGIERNTEATEPAPAQGGTNPFTEEDAGNETTTPDQEGAKIRSSSKGKKEK